jgi:hypothetical protein
VKHVSLPSNIMNFFAYFHLISIRFFMRYSCQSPKVLLKVFFYKLRPGKKWHKQLVNKSEKIKYFPIKWKNKKIKSNFKNNQPYLKCHPSCISLMWIIYIISEQMDFNKRLSNANNLALTKAHKVELTFFGHEKHSKSRNVFLTIKQ